jgi:hypothetical protein
MTGQRNKTKKKSRAISRPKLDMVQFAPNFSAYVLPPDVVCLYSEDRKFFLHGELYCAVVEAIGQRGKSASALVGELGRKFPPDRVEEALKRLIDRRYVVVGSQAATGTVAGYWASLGLPAEVAEANLKSCPVRIEAIDVEGAKELAAALRELGVHVVSRSPALTITLVNDYLERQLAELNQQHVSAKTPWILVQPSGVFPLVGPVFNPGESACWTCLFDRMIRKGDRQRLSYRFARSHCKLRPVGRDHCQALRGEAPAMPDLRKQETAEPAPRPAAGRASAGWQVDHDQRWIPLDVVARYGGAVPQACQSPHRGRHQA